MATYTNIPRFQAAMKAKAKALRRGAVKSSHDAAVFMEATARALAPVHTGETIKGIRKRKKGKGYQVESRVKPKGASGFRQNLWANQTAPFRSVKMVWPSAKGKSVVYGDGTHKTSGTPRFFHLATFRTSIKFKDITRKNTKKALRVTV